MTVAQARAQDTAQALARLRAAIEALEATTDELTGAVTEEDW